MDMEPEVTPQPTVESPEFPEPAGRKPLELLRDTEGLLRRQTIETLTPVLPQPLATRLEAASTVAETSLQELAEIDLDEISDAELQPARIFMGLTFVGLGALLLLFLLLYLTTLRPELSPVEQIQQYWYQYIWFVCIGVAGMFMLGREAMRPQPEARIEQEEEAEGQDLRI
jgi:hypothetical protein